MWPLFDLVTRANFLVAKDQQSNMLISRVAGLGTLRHRPIGFTGPLSQHLLGYNSVINIVRQTLRDLVEVAATHMFLTGCCDRLAVDLSLVASKSVYLRKSQSTNSNEELDFLSDYPQTARSASPSSLILMNYSATMPTPPLPRPRRVSWTQHLRATSHSPLTSLAILRRHLSSGMPFTRVSRMVAVQSLRPRRSCGTKQTSGWLLGDRLAVSFPLACI